MKAILQLFIVIVILIVAAAFAALNDQVINLNYFIGEVESRLTFVIISSFFLGMLFCFLLLIGLILKGRMERRRMRQELRLKNQELTNLRELPVKEDF